MATSSSTKIHHTNSITFDEIIKGEHIDNLDKIIVGAQKSFSSKSLPQNDDNTAPANVADDKEPDESVTNGNGGSIQMGQVKEKENPTRPLIGKLEKVRNDLKYIRESLTYLREYEDHVAIPFETVSHRVKHIVDHINNEPLEDLVTGKNLDPIFIELDKMLMDMKIHIPSSNKMYMSAANVEAQRSTLANMKKMRGDRESNELEELPVLQSTNNFSSNPAFLDIKEIYNSLRTDLRDFQYKLCLLCFSIFPEDVIVKKRILINWWVGEGLISGTKTADQDQAADEILIKLVNKGFIEPVDQKYREVANSFWMHPLIRSAVIVLSKEVGFFDFNDRGEPTLNFESSRRACLVDEGSSSKLTKTIHKYQNEGSSNNSSQRKSNVQEKLITLYNVNEQYLKLEPEWFQMLKNVQVLQLGRWMDSAENHIEVENVEFLRKMEHMKLLMYFSLQGISRISELPDSIGNLTNLRILDLRACHNLERLPKTISSLKYLTHLDMSECFLLVSVPKEISSLSNLEVLKGFVIAELQRGGNSCTLHHLKALKALRKLSIRTGLKDFPRKNEVEAIEQFTALCNLKIIWGGKSLKKSIDTDSPDKKGDHRATLRERGLTRSRKLVKVFTKKDPAPWSEKKFPDSLKKLDLQCFPKRERPSWLNPTHLLNLKKLYIRGGRLSDLVDKDKEWSVVETLRLKHLHELSMDWTERQEYFPELKYLEVVQCPKLTFFPCDDKGVWTQ